MSIVFILASVCLIAFLILATFDGVYLHLWRFELFSRKESRFEHLIHTIRAILFPIILVLLFINTDQTSFSIGLTLVVVDLIVLGLDAYSEEDSRKFMGGLPKWEYILHLFANSLHFATFLLIIATRLRIGEFGIKYSTTFESNQYFEISQRLAQLVIPGAVLLGLLHLVLNFELGTIVWNSFIKKKAAEKNS
jgi:hypothetical protein